MEKKIYTIYKITNKVNGKLYIGFTSKEPKVRLGEHFGHAFARKYKPDGSRIKKAIRKYGRDNFTIEGICCSLHRDYTLNTLEPYFIKLFDTQKNGYNIMPGGAGISYVTEETKQKISRVKKEWYATHPNPNLGQKRPNAGANISKAKKGKTPDRVWTDEQRKKSSERVSGKKNPFYGTNYAAKHLKGKKLPQKMVEAMSNTWKILHPDGTETIELGLNKFCRDNNLSAGTLRMTSIGLRKHHKGYKCELIERGILPEHNNRTLNNL